MGFSSVVLNSRFVGKDGMMWNTEQGSLRGYAFSASVRVMSALAAGALLAFAGCSQQGSAQQHSQDHSHSHADNHQTVTSGDFELPEGIDASRYVLISEPEDAQEVIAVRESARDDEEVVVVGRIGGGENPWIEGRAAFSIVDNSLKACSDIPGDGCPIPWDYCCETHNLPTASVLVTVVDQNGDMVKADARALLKAKELSTVVVKGKAKRDRDGNLLVLASGVYVKEI
jgi:hypothetical protein